MSHFFKILLILLFGLSATTSADENQYTLPDLDTKTTIYRLKAVDSGMDRNEYRDSIAHNREMLENFAINSLQNKLAHLGVSKNIAGLAGASAQLALGHAQLCLNTKKTFYVDLDDATKQDRSVFLKWKLSW